MRLASLSGSREAPAALELSFDSIYAEHFDFLTQSLHWLGVEPGHVDDAVQDVFLVVHRRLSEFKGLSALKTWLYGIALRVARDHRRRKGRKGESELLTSDLPDLASGPFERASASQSMRQLQRLLAQLSDEKREVYVLAELEQMTAAETAQLLGLSLTTVNSRLRVAREELASAWNNSGPKP